MIRVLHVIGKMDRGGAETLLVNLHRAIDASRVQFDYLVHTSERGEYDEEISKLGGRVFHIPPFRGANIRSYRAACREFLSDHPELQIVHGHIGSCAALYLSVAHELGRFTVAHSHSRHFPLSANEIAFRLASFPTRFVADYFIACSVQAGIDRYGKGVVNSNRFKILRNGIALDQFVFDGSSRCQIRDELGIAEDTFAIAHVGRLTAVKNHPFLFRCFSDILGRKPSSELFLVGMGEDEERLVQLSKEMGIAQSVHFLGLRDDVPSFLMGMDAFIFPSRSEGLPLACVEAQASGLPCHISSGVSEEVLFSPIAKLLPLAAGAGAWADEVLSAGCPSDDVRRGCVEYAREAGYDVLSAAEWLVDFYERALA